MPCSKVSVNKNFKCDKASCICIPTDGKPCICVCENEDGDIIRCDDCKCSTGNCQCKCDDSKCTCIVTKGADCVCICRDERGNIMTCDCSCVMFDQVRPCCKNERSVKSCDCCSKKLENNSSGSNYKNVGKRYLQTQRRDVIRKSYRCNQAGCVCIPTDGKPSICVCENEDGDIIRCDDCKCSTGSGQCKCDDSKCTCIVTRGVDCICFCRDERGNIKTCDCSCYESDEARACCTNKHSFDCCSKKVEKKNCGISCKNIGKRDLQTQRRDATRKSYRCNQAGCVCIPTDGKSCICVCENEDGDIIRCDDCKCSTGNCQCKCDDSKCTCIVTKGADCVCICRDEKGNIKTCDCSCVEFDEGRCCCKNVRSVKSCDCCFKKLEKNAYGSNCISVGKQNSPTPRHDATRKNYRGNQAGCVCIPTDGKPCICVCENVDGDIIRCDDCKCSTGNCQCKCDDSKCTCVGTKGADCICICRDKRGNITTCDCSCTNLNEAICCKHENFAKFRDHVKESCRGKNNDNHDTKYCCVPNQYSTSLCCAKKEKSVGRSICRNNLKAIEASNKCPCAPEKKCVCLCENKKGDLVYCDDCKCDNNGNCKKEGCLCISKANTPKEYGDVSAAGRNIWYCCETDAYCCAKTGLKAPKQSFSIVPRKSCNFAGKYENDNLACSSNCNCGNYVCAPKGMISSCTYCANKSSPKAYKNCTCFIPKIERSRTACKSTFGTNACICKVESSQCEDACKCKTGSCICCVKNDNTKRCCNDNACDRNIIKTDIRVRHEDGQLFHRDDNNFKGKCICIASKRNCAC